LVHVSFDAQDPVLAASVVDAVFDNYLQFRTEEANRSVELLEMELKSTKAKLDSAEVAFRAHVESNGLEIVETGKGEMVQELNDRLRSLSAAVADAQAERFLKQSAYEQAVSRAERGEANGPVIEALTVRLADLRREYAKQTVLFHDAYPSVKALKSEIVELERALENERQLAVGRLERDYRAADRREGLLRASLSRQSSAALALDAHSPGSYESLKREVITGRQTYALLDQRLQEVRISSALKASNVAIVDRPEVPEYPLGLSPVVNIGLSAFVGLLMAVGGVFVREYVDTTVRTVEDVGGHLGVPALAAIPAVRSDLYLSKSFVSDSTHRLWWRIDQQDPSRSLSAPQDTSLSLSAPRDPSRSLFAQEATPRSLFTEAFAALRTVLISDEAAAPQVVLITSAQSMEGKTTVSVNLALSLARLNARVLLIDANMRFSCVHDALGLRSGPGLSEYLTSDTDWRTFLQTGSYENLDVLAAGKTGANPADLLALPRLRELMTAAAVEYDFVLLDSPALLANPADVRSLAAAADGVLVTVRQGWTSRETVTAALSQLTRVIGVVLNRSDPRDVSPNYRDITLSTAV